MGISTYQSYCGAQIFEPSACRRTFVEKYFTGTPTNIGASASSRLPTGSRAPHRKAPSVPTPVLADMLDVGGEYAFRVRGEDHMWTPDTIAKLLQHATRNPA